MVASPHKTARIVDIPILNPSSCILKLFIVFLDKYQLRFKMQWYNTYKCFFVNIGSADGHYSTLLIVPSVCDQSRQLFRCAANLTFTESLLLWIQETFDSWTSILASQCPPRPPGSPLWPEMLNILLECSEVTVWPGVTCVLSGVNIIWYLQGGAVMVSMDDSDASTRDGRTMHDKMFLHKWEPFQTLSPLTLITWTIMVRNH